MNKLTRNLLIVFVNFIISFLLVVYGLTMIAHNIPEEKAAIAKANITRLDISLNILGKDLPKEKEEAYNSISTDKIEKFDTKTKIAFITNIVLFPSLLLAFIISVIPITIINRRDRKKDYAADQAIKNSYFAKYPVGKNRFIIKCIDSSMYERSLTNKNLIIWIDKNSFNMINNDYRNDIGLHSISLDDLICFSRYGDFYTTTHISGGHTSYGRAALGYVIAGGAGAVLASRTPVTGGTVVHDKRETLMFFRKESEDKFLFFEPKLYDYLMRLMPNKEITYKSNFESFKSNNLNAEGKYEKLIKLGEMNEKGLISDIEFEKLKNELL